MEAAAYVFFALILAFLAIVYGRKMWSNKRQDEQDTAAVTSLAQQVGADLKTGNEAELPKGLAPSNTQGGGQQAALGAVGGVGALVEPGGTELSFSMRFQRGRWQARVAQAQWNEIGVGNYQNDRLDKQGRSWAAIEIATPPCPTMGLVCKSAENERFGIPIRNTLDNPPNWMQPPSAWQPAPIPQEYQGFALARTSDPHFAGAAFNPTALAWLRHNSSMWRSSLCIWIEPGVLYIADTWRLTGDEILPYVDLLTGFLERIPAQAWGNPQQGTR